MRFIGCGTARCGSTSLYELINGCNGVTAKHERHLIKYRLPYVFDVDKVESTIKRLNSKQNYGEIAFWFLPYVASLLARINDLKVICLKRNIDNTYRSFLKHLGNKNPWSTDLGEIYEPDPVWDDCYPKYGKYNIKESVYRFYREYYYCVESLQTITDRVKIFDTERLNSRDGQDSIFEFLSIPVQDRVYKDNCRYNVSDLTV